MKSKLAQISFTGMLFLLLAVVSINFNPGKIETTASPPIERSYKPPALSFSASYDYVPFVDMIKYAHVILVGEITNIGETKWNQEKRKTP